MRPVLSAHVDELHAALDIAPQTNEVGRSTALVVGLFAAVRRSGLTRVRLLDRGASAGLNLLVDQIRFVGEGWSFGPEHLQVEIDSARTGGVHIRRGLMAYT